MSYWEPLEIQSYLLMTKINEENLQIQQQEVKVSFQFVHNSVIK